MQASQDGLRARARARGRVRTPRWRRAVRGEKELYFFLSWAPGAPSMASGDPGGARRRDRPALPVPEAEAMRRGAAWGDRMAEDAPAAVAEAAMRGTDGFHGRDGGPGRPGRKRAGAFAEASSGHARAEGCEGGAGGAEGSE